MADDWDLYAVVRGCKSTTQTTRNITITAACITPTNPIHTPLDEFKNDPLWDLLNSDELTDPLFSFTNLDDPKEANGFQELQQSFFRNPTTTTNNDHNPTTNNTTFGPNNIIPNSPTISYFGGSSGSGQHHLQHQQQQQHHHAQLQQQLQHQQHLSMPTHFTRGIPAPSFRGIYGQQQQQQQKIMQPGDQNLQPRQLQTQQGFRRPKFINPAYPHPRLPTRPQRRMKTQQKKNVHEVKAEDLISADLWAWRKYGQKPIKGSPHPRNYYRCSSSKGCPARRQVEQSTTEPNIFIVTYTGDHTHARPTHRNSLAGSSRNKLSAASTSQKQPINNDSGSTAVPNPSSPTTGLPMTVQAEAVPVANKVSSDNSLDKENEESDEEEETDHENENENEVEDDDVMIPDMDMSDEIFLGLKELGGTSSNGSGSGSFSGFCFR
ncbi:hypothetical protein ACFX14_042087 [Malus domestica]